MRPLILTITAFGPYATKQVIDFNELQGRNLFVITGDTGAGKTTILDAISYALYGKASGRDRDGENLRSHFATSDLLTSVEMEFELQGERYWVKRIPKQRKKKTRGEGYTDQNAEAEFKNLAGEVRVVSGVKEVDEKIVDLMGLNYHQFKQIIMIPQGEFRELLNADSKARQDILQKIFGTEGLRRVQELFESEAKGLVQEVTALESQQNECIRSLDGSGYLPLAEILMQTSYNAVLVVDELKQAIACDVNSSNELQQLIALQEEKVLAKQGEIFAGKENNIKISNCELAYQHKILLEAQQLETDEKKGKLAQAKRAAGVTVIAEYQQSRTINVQKKKALLVKAEQQEVIAKAKATAATLKYQQEKANDGKRSELVASQARLNELVVKVADLDIRQNQIVKEEQVLNTAQKTRDNVKKQLQETRGESSTCQVRLDEAKEALTEYGRKIIEMEKIDELCTKFKVLQVESNCLITLGQTMLTLKQEESKAHLQYEESQTDYEKAQQLFYEGQAGNLALTLKTGEACPVCGSENHPRLASILASNISEDELKQCHIKSKQARERYDKVKSNYDRNNGDHYAQEQILARLIKELSLLVTDELADLSLVALSKYSADKFNEYQILKKGLDIELTQLANYKKAESELATTLTQKSAAISVLAQQLEVLENEYTNLYAKVQSGKDAINKLESEVPINVRSTKALTIEIKRIHEELTISQQALNSAQEDETSSKVSYATAVAGKNAADQVLQEEVVELNIATQKFMTALLTAGFAQEVDYEAAKLTEEQMTNLEQQINNYQEALRSAVDAHSKAELEVKGISAVDINALEAQQQSLQAEKNKLIDSRTNIMARQINNETMFKSIAKIMKKITTCADEHLLIGHLAKIAKGDNEQKVSFERYVLAAFFNDIIDAANVRLKKMTGGRYQMSRIVQKGKGNGQSGLEIEVFDYYTGQSRHVKTLSGGESFKASLALALGLAQVVQSYAGGISLETMFVDEGFGTLDPESLDTAISCLIDLQNSGRLVGIISHVPELKSNIDARLEIEACKDGSNATFYIS